MKKKYKLIQQLLSKPTLLWRKVQPTHAAIDTLLCYRKHDQWVFDDERNGLQAEAFVCGMSEIIDSILRDNGIAPVKVRDGFRLTFSPFEFPNATHTLKWQCKTGSGNTYRCVETGQEGWLCPALLMYFNSAPPVLYTRADTVTADTIAKRKSNVATDDEYEVEDFIAYDDCEEQFL